MQGEAFDSNQALVRSADRNSNAPDKRNFNIGFRCAQ